MPKIPVVYVDTSVSGGCFDPEFSEWSNQLLADFHQGVLRPMISVVTSAEVASAPDDVLELYKQLRQLAGGEIDLHAAAMELANEYVRRGILTEKYMTDALHIAVATTAVADVLVSWNFRHIVRFDKIRMFNTINMELGYRSIDIRSPQEVASYGI
jgi:hypothetical protein